MSCEWQQFKIWKDVSRAEFEDSAWQDKHAVIRVTQLEAVLGQLISRNSLHDIETGLLKAGMSIRLNPYIISLIDWSSVEADPIRRQFLPMASEIEDDHPCLVIDSLEEVSQSPVQGLVHRYPDKALFLVTSVCPVYCQYCTRSYAVGLDTQLIQKEHVAGAKNWAAALDYIRLTRRSRTSSFPAETYHALRRQISGSWATRFLIFRTSDEFAWRPKHYRSSR